MSLAAELGVKLTPAGATWPYGKDPKDTNIRIAPTFPTLEELGQALDVFVVAVKLVSARLACRGQVASGAFGFLARRPLFCVCCRRPGKTGALGAK